MMGFSFFGNNFSVFLEEFLNVLAAFLLSSNWTNSNDVAHVLEFLSNVNSINEIIHHGNLLLKSALFLKLRDSTEGITHNSNKNVHENE